MQDLRVTLFQSSLHWHEPQANRAMFEEKIWANSDSTDLIVLPEMFTTGFSMDAPQLAEPMGTGTHVWMKQMAKQTKSAIVGSYIVKENGQFFNRLLFVTPEGKHTVYDKRHLFRMASEHHTYQQGVEKPVILWRGWNICPQICYDLRFPVWSRNRVRQGKPEYDLLIYVANWPAPRVNAWDTLLQARAIENASYCIGVNRVGKDGNEIEYSGHSAVIDPKGSAINFVANREETINSTLSSTDLSAYREKFPVHLDADDFTIQV